MNRLLNGDSFIYYEIQKDWFKYLFTLAKDFLLLYFTLFCIKSILIVIYISGFYYGQFYHNIDTYEYDIIVVGSGTAGVTIAKNLYRQTNYSVLLIEAGSYTNSLLQIPYVAPALHQSQFYDWNYKTTSQLHACRAMNDNQCPFTLGKSFGGSNTINNMIYFRGFPNDFQDWFGNATDYNFENDVKPFFESFEREIDLSNVKHHTKIGESVLTSKMPEIFKFIEPKLMQNGGKRSFGQDIIKSSNNILINTKVTRLLLDDKKNNAVGVEISNNQKILARHSVILSAGAIGSPLILQRSGIGPCELLNNLGIECNHDLPVGQNLQDHLAVGIDMIILNETMKMKAHEVINFHNLIDYFVHGKGPLTSGGCEAIGWAIPKANSLPTIGFMVLPVGISSDYGVKLRYTMNIKENVWKSYLSELKDKTVVSIIPINLHPKSRGTVMLTNNDIASKPSINPNYLQHPDDVNTLIEGIELLKDLLQLSEFKSLGAHLYSKTFSLCSDFKFSTKKYWECYIRHMSFSVYHPIGTCRMGFSNDPTTVVNHQFQVKGINNLFVVDGSLMRNLPSGNPNAAVGMLAHKFLKYFKTS